MRKVPNVWIVRLDDKKWSLQSGGGYGEVTVSGGVTAFHSTASMITTSVKKITN